MELKITMKAARVNAGMTLRDAAKALGVATATLVSWEQGRTSPTLEKARKLSEIYNFPLEHIFLQ